MVKKRGKTAQSEKGCIVNNLKGSELLGRMGVVLKDYLAKNSIIEGIYGHIHHDS